jgi:hypothetical protein
MVHFLRFIGPNPLIFRGSEPLRLRDTLAVVRHAERNDELSVLHQGKDCSLQRGKWAQHTEKGG